jgi:nucleotide-binding universal stress UspA family protein
MYKKILLGVDDSENAVRAANKVIEMQRLHGSKVVAFHSVIHHLSEISPGFGFLNGGSGVISLTLHEESIRDGERVLDTVKKLFEENNAKIETRLVFDIPPEDYIKKTIEEENFDLIVLGSKGHHSKLSRALLGTIPDKVINDTVADVLIIQ